MKRFACQDIIPGCDHVFTGADDQSVLDQVIAHAAVDHGLVKPPLALVELVVATTHTFVPPRGRAHLRLVGTQSIETAEPDDPTVHSNADSRGQLAVASTIPSQRDGALHDGAGHDGAGHDGAWQDGSLNDGAVRDGVVTEATNRFRRGR